MGSHALVSLHGRRDGGRTCVCLGGFFSCSIAGDWYGFVARFPSWPMLTARQVNAYGTYASYYMQHLIPNQDILLLNLVGSTQSFVVLMLSAPVGRFLDAGYIRHLLVAGTILVGLGSFLLSVVNGDASFASGRWALIWLTQGLISGLGMACFFVSSSQGKFAPIIQTQCIFNSATVVATWFKAKKGLAIGIVAVSIQKARCTTAKLICA